MLSSLMDQNSGSSDWKWRLRKSIASSSDDGHALIDELNQALSKWGWEGRDSFHIHMATEEAIVNAIEHGNKRDPSKTVAIDFRINDDEVWLEITDQGEGFRLEDLKDPLEEENLEQPRGRGVLLIRELMSEVRYNCLGNSVIMVKRRSPPYMDCDD